MSRIRLVSIFMAFCCVFVSTLSTASDIKNIELPNGIMKLNGIDAPALELEDLDGETWNVNDARGHWVFLHFWATWCGPCRREMPTIQTLITKVDTSKIEIKLVNTAESEDLVFSFIGVVAPDLNPLMDIDGQATETWQPRGLPATFFIDPDGKLQYLALGGREWHTKPYLDFINKIISK